MISVVDTHAHVDMQAFDEDRDAMLIRARSEGVHAIVAIGHNPERWVSTRQLHERYPWIVRSVGLHPNDADRWSADVERALALEAAEPDVIAIGETGLDFYRDSADPDLQRAAFAAQCRIAVERDLPVIIHQRHAEDETLAILAEFPGIKAIMHCFSGDLSFAQRCQTLDVYFGIGGVLTFPKSTSIRAAVATLPADRIVLETDAPFLAPQPWRGKRNEPAFLVETAAQLAALRSMSMAEVARATSANAEQLFGPKLAAAREVGMRTHL